MKCSRCRIEIKKGREKFAKANIFCPHCFRVGKNFGAFENNKTFKKFMRFEPLEAFGKEYPYHYEKAFRRGND